MQLELLASGYGLAEGPRTDALNNLYFTDILAGCVHRRHPDGSIETLVSGRTMVSGLALHADGGFIMSGPTVAHWRDGEVRIVLEREGVSTFNDIQPDDEGGLYVGSIRRNLDMRDMTPDLAKGECYRIDPSGAVDELYGDVALSNGIGLSPDGRTIYHADSSSKAIWVHDLAADGSASNRRLIGAAAFARGIPDGLCVDTDGNLWVAHVGGRRVVKLSPAGDELGEIAMPAKAVTSVSFGGPDNADMYIVTGDHIDQPDLKGCVFRCRPGVAGRPTPLVTI